MSHRSIRFYLFAAALWLSAVPSSAQDAAGVTLKLSVAEVAEITRLIDLQPQNVTPPAAYWDLQTKIDKSLQANPDALRTVLSIRSARR
jgi:hypothetical protein